MSSRSWDSKDSSKSTLESEPESSAFAPRDFAPQARRAVEPAAEEASPGDLFDAYLVQRRAHLRATIRGDGERSAAQEVVQAKSAAGGVPMVAPQVDAGIESAPGGGQGPPGGLWGPMEKASGADSRRAEAPVAKKGNSDLYDEYLRQRKIARSAERVSAHSPREKASREAPRTHQGGPQQLGDCGRGPGVVQRAVVLLEMKGQDGADDYALQKVLSGFDLTSMVTLLSPWEATDDRPNPTDPAATNHKEFLILYQSLPEVEQHAESVREGYGGYDEIFLLMDEDVFIVGHGGPGLIWTEPGHKGEVRDFGPMIKAIQAMAPQGWRGKIRVLTCNSEVAGSGGSVADKLGEGWAGEPDRVTGTGGFAYGIGAAAEGNAEKMNVLKPEFDALYNATNEDIHTAQHLLQVARANPGESIRLINFNPDGRNMSDSELETDVWVAFTTRMKAIEGELKTIVAGDKEPDPVRKARNLRQIPRWNELAGEQHALFAHFELWA